jgi:GMP synthase-like glutamine amidotransferase
VSPAADRVRLLVVRNDPTDPPALLGRWWSDIGVELIEIHADAGAPVPTRLPDDVDGLVVLGGAMAAWEDERAPWLPAERELLASSVAAGRPVLGVCLGGQLLALACGGTVERAAVAEVGVTELTLTGAAAADPLFAVLPQGAPVGQYHQDAIGALPAGAVHLASTEVCRHQAFRLGESAWGVQFHPEIDAGIIATWLPDDPEPVTRSGATVDGVVAGMAAREAEMADVWRPFAEAFVDVVRG